MDASEAATADNAIMQDVDEVDLYGDIGGNTEPAAPGSADEGQAARQNSGQQAEPSSALQSTALVEVPERNDRKRTALKQPLVDSSSIYVGNLQWWTSDADLEALCKEFGEVINIQTFEEKGSGKSKGYMLVEFDCAKSANLCKQSINGAEINGKKCVVTFPSSTTGPYKGPYGMQNRGDARGKGGRGGIGRGGYSGFGAGMMPPFGGMPGGMGMGGMGMMGMSGMGMMGMPGRFPPGMPFPPMMDSSGSHRDNDSDRSSKRYRY